MTIRDCGQSSAHGLCARMGDETRTARHQSLSKVLRRSASRHGNKTAIICGEVRWSYAELDRIVDNVAAALSHLGIAPGDRIAILARNSHAFVAIRFAVARLGAVLVPVNVMLNAADVRYILEHSGARMLFVDASTHALASDAAPDAIKVIFGLPGETTALPTGSCVRPWTELLVESSPFPDVVEAGSLLQIIYTSGTESRPKGTMLTHDAVLWEYQSCIVDLEWNADTVALHALPLFHCAQLDCMLGPALSVGACNIVTAVPAPENMLALIGLHRVTSVFCPPTTWIALLRSPLFEAAKLASLVKGYYGGGSMPTPVLQELRTRLPMVRLWNLYGQTEIAPVATILFPEEHATHSGSAGRPTLHVQTRVVDDQMRDMVPGSIGEIVHQSPQLMTGYWRDPERTAESFAGGWFHSGDLGWIDADGYLTVVDRKKDMIKTGGENVSSREVEDALYTHPLVSEVVVIGLPHARWIEAVTAIVVLRDDSSVSEDELIRHCVQHLARFKLPKRVIFLQTLPRTATGKVLKRDLRERYLSGAQQA